MQVRGGEERGSGGARARRHGAQRRRGARRLDVLAEHAPITPATNVTFVSIHI